MRATIPIQSPDEIRALLGIGDKNALIFRTDYGVAVTVRKGALQIDGEEERVEAARRAAVDVLERLRSSDGIDPDEVAMLLKAGGVPGVSAPEALIKTRANRVIVPRTDGQRRYVAAMKDHEVVFSIGPAGTGKTYLAVAMAVRMLREGMVKKLVLTRPAVEAGEKLGFLPGTYEAKINPYLRPLYDALHELVDPAQIRKFAESDVIEVAPLAFMRGRTLSDAFIILDEGQNTTPSQMKMFLTRMGEGSRLVVTGDVTQIDLPTSAVSGLIHAAGLMEGIDGIGVCRLDRSDIVRHPVVQRMVDAYETDEA